MLFCHYVAKLRKRLSLENGKMVRFRTALFTPEVSTEAGV